MEKNNKVITITDLAEGLGMDRSNLNKLVKKLKIKPTEVRGKINQWTTAFSAADVDLILKYREGIPHNLVKLKGSYSLKGAK